MISVVETGIAASKSPASGAVRIGNMLFTTLVPKDPVSGRIVETTIEGQTRQALSNLGQIMAAAGGSLENVAQVQIFLVAKEDAAGMNAVYAEMMPNPFPARATVVVKELLSPQMRIEMTVVAVLESG